EGWLRDGCKAPKVVELLTRHTGVAVPLRTLQRFVQEELAPADDTVRIVDPPPGEILEVDFAELGRLVVDGGRGPKVHALICTPGRSRYTFVWPSLDMDLDTV